MAVKLSAAEFLHVVEIAGLARNLGDALHRTPNHHDLAVRGARGVGDGFQPRDVRGESRDGDTTARGADQLSNGLCDIGLRRRAALAYGVGGIANQREAALLTQRAQLFLVRGRPEDWRRIDLPVTGMQ